MDIVVKGRNVEVPDHFRQHVQDKLALSERLGTRVIRVDVELSHEKNPRQSARCQRVEITVLSKGPVIRAEACAETFYAALDAANLKLEARLRKHAHDVAALRRLPGRKYILTNAPRAYALRVLRTAGLVSTRKDGRVVFYRLSTGFPVPLRDHCLRALVDLSRTVADTDDD